MEYYGKQKCRILKEIRAEIAKQNDIEWVVEECKHKGNCRGTCPRCEAEVVKLEKELARRQAMGKAVAVVGISAALSLTVTGCEQPFATQGDMQVEGLYPESTPAVSEKKETDGEIVMQGELLPETYVLMGGKIPPEDMTDTVPPIPGEAPDQDETDTETDTETDAEPGTDTETDPADDLPLMGEPAWEDGQ